MQGAESVHDVLEKLSRWFAGADGMLVAFSGGVDSSLVAFLARHYLGSDRSLAVISASPSLKLSELENARTFARRHDIPLEVIVTSEMENTDYTSNPANRCYYCKHTLYTELDAFRERFPGWVVANGQNADDAGDYRPGLKAAREFAVCAPLAECGLDKAMVRKVAAHFALECWDKPASPCLSSRVPYGEEITIAKLRQIDAAETLMTESGFDIVRVRHLGKTARIEVPPERLVELQQKLALLERGFAEIGFDHVETDPEGFVSGKLNRALGL